jgi:hypothetical protein
MTDAQPKSIAQWQIAPDWQQPELQIAMPELLRKRLVDEAWRLAYDPFKVAVSESDAAFNFARIYVDPPLEAGQQAHEPYGLRERLKQARHSFVFASYGMGKTATSLALAHELREAYSHVGAPTLFVTYQPTIRPSPSGDERSLLRAHLTQIARHMTIDLVIQTLERLSERFGGPAAFSQTESEAFTRQLWAAPRSLRVVLKRIAQGKARPDKLWGVLRPTVRPEIATAAWFADVRALVEPHLDVTPLELEWPAIVADAKALGFGQIFLSLDALDEGTINMDVLEQRIAPLLPLLATWQLRELYLKCFLPVDLRPYFVREFTKKSISLTPPPDLATIANSTPEHLIQIIDRRLQAALTPDSSISSLDDLRGPGMEAGITQTLASEGRGSPRAVLELASRLIAFHSSHGFATSGRLWITADEWRAFLDEIRAPG